MRRKSIPGIVAGAVALLASAVGGAGAQEIPDVAILNDHLHVHKVFVVDARGEQHQLGFVGHDQLKTFDVPTKIESMGPYRIALQQYLPLAGNGVSAAAFPMKVTPVLEMLPRETITIVVGPDTETSTVEVVNSRLGLLTVSR
jgi:hypothetical protein